MNLSADTQRIIEQVEQVTGYSVEFISNAALPTMASVKIARGNMPSHLVSYKPGPQGVDYAIAFQCGFVLRVFQNPPETRLEFQGVEEGKASVYKSLAGPNGTLKPYNLPDAAIRTVTNEMYDGLMIQLRSMPIGMRVDAWIRDAYPGLRAEQEQSFALQHADATKGLSPQVRKMSPPTVFSANALMHAAFALFCDRLLGRTLYSIPYRSMGLTERGQELLDIWDALPNDAASDRALVDAWGSELGLTDWYAWIPLQQ